MKQLFSAVADETNFSAVADETITFSAVADKTTFTAVDPVADAAHGFGDLLTELHKSKLAYSYCSLLKCRS